MSLDSDTSTEFDQIVHGEHDLRPDRPKRGRPRNTTPTEPRGLTFSAFEADMLAADLNGRAADILRDNPEDEFTQRRAKFLQDTANEIKRHVG